MMLMSARWVRRRSHARHLLLRSTACFPLLLLLPACGPAQEDASQVATQPAQKAASGLAVVTGTAPPGAIVTLEAAGAEPAPVPEGPVIMDQFGKQFIPDVLYARVGQTVEFRNSENVDHNVQVLRLPAGITVMNESGSKGHVFTHVFERAGLYEVVCDVHPGMRAAIIVTSAPRAAYAANRSFSFADIPPGTYVLKTIASGRETSQEIEVTAPRTTVTAR